MNSETQTGGIAPCNESKSEGGEYGIGKIPQVEQEKYGERWEDAEEPLGREGFADLFSHD